MIEASRIILASLSGGLPEGSCHGAEGPRVLTILFFNCTYQPVIIGITLLEEPIYLLGKYSRTVDTKSHLPLSGGATVSLSSRVEGITLRAL